MKKIKEITRKILSNQYARWILLALAITFFCDILNQRSFATAFVRVFTKPLNFIYNLLIVLATISLSGLFSKRRFALVMFCFPWVALPFANFILQFFRNTPLSFMDFMLIFSVFSIIENYLNTFHIILIILGILLLIFGLIVLYRKDKRQRRSFFPSIITFTITFVLALCLRRPFVKIGALSDDYSNLTIAYRDYGLPYCFVVSVVERNVEKPDKYNKELVEDSVKYIEELMKQLDGVTTGEFTVNSGTKPNVIFLQLESFIDANHLLNLEYSENPTPFFESLKAKYPSGALRVPTFGAGTANVEFEIMSGLNLDYFGAGEYPYITVMSNHTTETAAYNLKEYGYYTTVMHNNRASFYSRDEVFEKMGYDRYVSAEFMSGLEYNDAGWAKDKCLINEIMKALRTSSGPDYIYSISVQPHGAYLDSMGDISNKEIEVTFKDGTDDSGLFAEYTYYINQLNEVDLFLKGLINELESYNEPIMLVLYGDHLPNFNLEDEDVLLNDQFKTEYIVWSNFDTKLDDKDLYTYEMSSYILQNIGCNNGIINKLHQTKELNENYDEIYHLLEYDIFEKRYLWGDSNPYKKLDMQLGYNDIEITNVIYHGGVLKITGKNFTDRSKVYFGNKKLDTTYIDANTLIVHIDDIKSNKNITVKQVSEKGDILSASDIFEYKIKY